MIGSNTLTPDYYGAQLTVGLDEQGVRWFWSYSLGYESHATDIIATPDGGVISSGYLENRLPYRVAFRLEAFERRNIIVGEESL